MSAKSAQTCASCVHQSKCWSTHTYSGNPISSSNVVINILVCRLQLGINKDQSAANLLKLLRPGMIRLLSAVKQSNHLSQYDVDNLLTEMQSTAIEYLLYDYKIGDRGRATPYLFDPYNGFLTKWVKWMVGKHRRFYSHHEIFDPYASNSEDDNSTNDHVNNNDHPDSGWDSLLSEQYISGMNAENDTGSEMLRKAMHIIDDGITLNSNEYRVLKFCLANGNESNASRHIDGLHIYLAKLMCVSRPRITRLYKRGVEKLKRRYIESLGDSDA